MESNAQILEMANAAVLDGDYEGFLSFCSEDTRWTFVGEQTLQGKAAVRKWMGTTYLEPPRFKVERLIAERDAVVAVGEIFLKDESGAFARHAYCDVWHFQAGKMVELRAFVVETVADITPAGK